MDRDQDFVLEVSLADFRRSRIASVSSEEPASGTVRFAIEHLALSANNLTYAALGDALGYWRLYPADEGWGRIPAWGCARVVESNRPDFVSGERYFGLLPMASAVTMRPSRTRADFREESPHRASLNPVYNRYARVGGQSDAELEDNSLFRPLFIASFTVDAYLTEADFFGAEALVIVSASAKAALGLAVLARGKRPVIALTSGSNAGFVASTGVYRDVIPYDGLEALGDVPSAVVVDFSGNAGLQQRIAQTLGSRLRAFHRRWRNPWDARSRRRAAFGHGAERILLRADAGAEARCGLGSRRLRTAACGGAWGIRRGLPAVVRQTPCRRPVRSDRRL